MAEFDELRLEVSIVDNASAQLDVLKRKIDDLGGSAKNLETLRRSTSEMNDSLKQLVETALRGPEAWLKYAAGLGAVGIAVEAVGLGVENLTQALEKMSGRMVNLGQAARSAAMPTGQLQGIIEQLREHGIGEQTAIAEVETFRKKVATSQLEMIAMMQRVPYLTQAHRNWLAQLNEDLRNTKAPEEQINLVKTTLQRIYDSILEIYKDPNIAEHVKRELAEKTGLERIVMDVEEPIRKVSADRLKAIDAEQKAATELVKTLADTKNSLEAIGHMLGTDLMNSPFGKGLKWIADTLARMRADMEKARAQPAQPGPSVFGQQGAPQQQPGGARDFRNPFFNPLTPGWRGGGGGAAQPQRLMGAGDQELPDLSGIRLNESNWDRMINDPELRARGAAHIEDRRGLIEDQNDQSRKLLENVRRTNSLLSGESGQPLGLLSTALGGLGAGLGTGIGRGGPMGALPGMPYGSSVGPGTGTGAPPAGVPPAGAPPAGAPPGGVPPAGVPPGAAPPGSQLPSTLPGAVAPLGYPGGGFTRVPSLTTPSGQPPTPSGAAVGGDFRIQGGRLPTPQELADKSRPIGERFQNPYNMHYDPYAAQQGGVDPKIWTGQYDKPAAFPSKTAGVAAAIRKMVESKKYGARPGGATLEEMVATWVSHPDGKGYAKFLEQQGFAPANTKFTREFVESEQGLRWLHAMARYETQWQNKAGPVSLEQMRQARDAALRRQGAATAQTASEHGPLVTDARTSVTTDANFPSLALDPNRIGPGTPAAPVAATGALVSPVTGKFGENASNVYGAGRRGGRAHSGVDWRAENGTTAGAMIGGTVTHVGHDPGGYDHYAVVRGDDGIFRRYAYHGQTLVSQGQRVEAGQPLGKIDRRHLHYEEIHPTLPNGQPNPVYREFVRSGNASTSHQRGTTDPSQSLRLTYGQPVTQGAPLPGQPTVTQVAGPSMMPGAQGPPPVTTLRTRPVQPPARLPLGDLSRELDRSPLDRMQGRTLLGPRRFQGTGRIDVSVKSRGQQSVSQPGPFKKVPWHRHQQMVPASQGPASPAESGGGAEE